MLKTLTLSLSLAVALGLCSVSKAGGLMHKFDGCATCGIASAQGPVVSPQAPAPSPQECSAPVCGDACAPKKCHLLDSLHGLGNKMSCSFTDLCQKLKPKPPVYTYEWVLKKKRVWGHHGGGCGTPGCDTCGVVPSAQGMPSSQVAPAPQAYGSGQASYGVPASGQIAASVGTLSPAPMVGGDEAPPAPPAPSPTGPTSSLLFSTPSGN